MAKGKRGCAQKLLWQKRIPMIRKRAVGMGHSVLGEEADPDWATDQRCGIIDEKATLDINPRIRGCDG